MTRTNSLAYLAANSPDTKLKERCALLTSELVNPTLADTLTKGSDKRVDWRCSAHSHEWEARVFNRVAGKGCPTCAGRAAEPLSITHPELVAELVNPELGSTLTKGSNKKVAWKCADHGHEWESVVVNRTNKGAGCPTCAGRVREPIGVTHPHLTSEMVDPMLANTLTKGSHKRVDWRCEFGHEWNTRLTDRVTKKSRCPTCARTANLAS